MSSSEKAIVLVTRESKLALWQANYVKSRLEALGHQVTLLPTTTEGDQRLDEQLSKFGGKGLFLKELEVKLMSGEADIAVHSMKDVPVNLPEGLELAVICERESPFDAMVSNKYSAIDELPKGAVVGTSSLRRTAMLLNYRPDLQIEFLRGNVQTRLAKLDAGNYDAIILAEAGLKRLELAQRIADRLSLECCLPAVGQGAVGIEVNADNHDIKQLLAPLHDKKTAICVEAEREVSRCLEGGCHAPMAVFAYFEQDEFVIEAQVAEKRGEKVLRESRRGAASEAEQLARALAEALLQQGARELLSA